MLDRLHQDARGLAASQTQAAVTQSYLQRISQGCDGDYFDAITLQDAQFQQALGNVVIPVY
jgi:hypothetical protein